MSNHTPGPWIVSPVTGDIMTDTLPPIYICKPSKETHRSERVEKQANARLIAAAPRLKAACQQAIAALEEAQGEWAGVDEAHAPEWTHPLKAAAAQARAAIDQAEPGA